MASATQSTSEKPPALEPKAAQVVSQPDNATAASPAGGTLPKKDGGAIEAAPTPDAAAPTGTRKSKKSNPSSSTLTKVTNNPTTPTVATNAHSQPQPSSSTNGAPPNGVQATKKSKRSFWKGFRSFFLPCIPSLDGGKAHDIDVETGASSKTAASTAVKEIPGEEKQLDEKAAAKAQTNAEAPPPPAKPVPSASGTGKAAPSDAAPATPVKTKPTPSNLTVPPPPAENDGDVTVVVPPSPHSQLLPRDETEGVTSGAVQPPGGSGADVSITDENEGDVADNEGGHGLGGDMDVEDDDDEEERLILAGGTGIPIGPDGKPCPLLPPLAPAHKGRKCLILDLDETLLHSSFKLIPQADYVVPVEIEWQWHNVYVIKRPGVDNFLKQMGELYEVVIFTASLSKYADPVLDKLDVHKVVAHRLFRESCYNHKGSYVKDLSHLGRPVEDMIILDNSPASYIFHPNNAVPVSSWFNDPHDTELTDLCPFLSDLMHVEDVRGVLDGGL